MVGKIEVPIKIQPVQLKSYFIYSTKTKSAKYILSKKKKIIVLSSHFQLTVGVGLTMGLFAFVKRWIFLHFWKSKMNSSRNLNQISLWYLKHDKETKLDTEVKPPWFLTPLVISNDSNAGQRIIQHFPLKCKVTQVCDHTFIIQ